MNIDQTALPKRAGAASAFDYSKSYLPEPPPGFYQQLGRAVIPVLGYEYKRTNYPEALKRINQNLALQLDSVDLEVFSHMFTGLAGARRFRGDLHISEMMGENSAAHSIHCPILATDFFRSAGLLARDTQNYNVMQLRMDICLGLLLHDMGEILGELSSLAQRTTNHDQEELPDVERDIFSITLTEAYRAVTSSDNDAIPFYEFLDTMHEDAGIGQGDGGSTDFQRLQSTIKAHKQRQAANPLPEDIKARIDRYLALYDMAELKDTRTTPYSIFVGNTIKVIEHLQGLRHLLRFASIDSADTRLNLSFPNRLPSTRQNSWVKEGVGDMIPMRYTSNYRMKKSSQYMHSGLRQMCEAASTPLEQALAQVVRNKLYEGMAEWVSVTRPVFDRSAQREDDFMTRQQQKLARERNGEKRAQILETIRDYSHYLLDKELQDPRATRDASFSGETLPDLITRREMIGLYLKAIEVDFTPSDDTPFTLFKEVPRELRGFHLIDYTRLLGPQATFSETPLADASFPS
jgi:hypothetical protein